MVDRDGERTAPCVHEALSQVRVRLWLDIVPTNSMNGVSIKHESPSFDDLCILYNSLARERYLGLLRKPLHSAWRNR